MGWLFMPRRAMGGFSTPKSYLDNQCTYPPDPEKGRKTGLRVLKSVWAGSEYYAAVEHYDETGTATGPALAIVCLVRWRPSAKNDEQFGYKDMDETMGPNIWRCPASVLDLLGVPGNAYAAEWRQRCRARLALTSRPKPKAGDRLILPEPMTFTDGHEGQSFTMVAWGKRLLLRGDNGGYYQLSNLMERAWTLIPKAAVAGDPAGDDARREAA